MSRYRELFVSESRDHLTAIEHALVDLGADATRREPLDALFRSVHTIKGMAGAMGYGPVAELSHTIEGMLDAIRAGTHALDRETLDLLFEGADALENLVRAATEGGTALETGPLVHRLARRLGTPAPVSGPQGPRVAGARDVSWCFELGTPLPAARAVLVTRRLAEVGTIHSVTPTPEAMEAPEFDGTVVAHLSSVEDGETLAALVRSCGFVTEVAIGPVQGAAAAPHEGAWHAGQLTAPLQSYVRLEARRLDHLMNLAGELVTLRGRLQATAAAARYPELDAVVGEVHHLVGELQDAVLGTRLVPVWQVFDRFPRVVRDAARTMGKEATLVIEGREIELDRALLEQVADPLVHLLRNAVDHGLEHPEDRERAGKPRVGKVSLLARRERSSVVISVVDDGRGVDRARMLARAREMGWVSPEEEELDDRDLLRLIARPGVSTAATVTEVSGRGVGVDAVIARVRALGGTVEFSTVEGRGTVFELRLPLSLAIVPAIIASCGDEAYALPLTHITETVQRSAGEVRRVRGRPVFVRRGRVLPLWSLRTLVGAPGRDPEGSQVVIVEAAERSAAVLVDRLSGQQDLVVKSFDPVTGMSAAITGAAVLADGSTALIVDAGGLLQGQ
jgi:two-component system chemotaxis sensor kinase CheA